jgi:hypothetical protein
VRNTAEHVHERMHFLGPIEDPRRHFGAADLYLEPFPFGSQTAVLEAGFAGLAPVLAWDPPCPLLVANDEALVGVASNSASEDEYVELTAGLIDDEPLRRSQGERFQRQVRACHVGEQWAELLGSVYSAVRPLRHAPRRLPVTHCEADEFDIAISQWQASTRGGEDADPLACRRTLITNCAFATREVGEYRQALSLLRAGARRWGFDRRMLAAAIKLAPHWVSRTWRSRSGAHR